MTKKKSGLIVNVSSGGGLRYLFQRRLRSGKGRLGQIRSRRCSRVEEAQRSCHHVVAGTGQNRDHH